MSLKAFHIAFISLCVVLALVLAAWSFAFVEGPMEVVWGNLSLLAAGALIIYARQFRRKMQDERYQDEA